MKVGGRTIPMTRCATCRQRMPETPGYPSCMSCTVPRERGETARQYRRRCNKVLGINLKPDGEPYG